MIRLIWELFFFVIWHFSAVRVPDFCWPAYQTSLIPTSVDRIGLRQSKNVSKPLQLIRTDGSFDEDNTSKPENLTIGHMVEPLYRQDSSQGGQMENLKTFHPHSAS